MKKDYTKINTLLNVEGGGGLGWQGNTKEKVGQPVENAVIKGVVQQLQDGKKTIYLL